MVPEKCNNYRSPVPGPRFFRILMPAPTPYFADRGCHVRIYEEARALRSLGHDVRILTYHLGRDMPGIPVIRIPRVPWYKKLEAGPSWHKLYLDMLLLCKGIPLLRSFRPHLIHAHLHEGAMIGYLLKKLAGLPLVLDYQGSLTGECVDHGFFPAGSPLAALFRQVERLINGSADRIVTSSGTAAVELVERWGVPRERVVPVIDGVDTDIFRPLPGKERHLSLSIPPGTPVVAYLGLLNRYQGIDLLLDCIAQLRADGVRVHFLIMGFPWERYRAEAETRGLADMITFTGRVDYAAAPAMLSAADVAVTPKLSITEANGKVFNYMACGVPVVAFDTPVNREALGDAGVYARYGDARDMASRIAALIADPEGRARRAEQVRDMAVREHSWHARARLIDDVYRGLVSRHA